MTRRSRRLAVAVALLLLCLGSAFAHARHTGPWRGGAAGARDGRIDAADAQADRGGARIAPGVAIARRPVVPAAVPASYYSAAQARAYAAAGQAQDGHPEALSALDAQARAALAAMRAELARQQPTVMATAAHAGADAVSSGAGAGGPGARLDLAHVDHGITGAPGSQVITGSQVWALAHLDPSIGKLDIENRSGGAYTISLFGPDFASVRLNGGLVVPGRAYAVGGAAEITGAAAVAVHIRPAGVATAVYPGPLLPQGDG